MQSKGKINEDIETYMQENNLKNFSEKRTIEILRQIRDGFEVLRREGVIHRDLKLSNIFMHNDQIIIGKI